MPPPILHTRKDPERRAYKPQFRQKWKRLRSPAGPRRLRSSDAHKRIAAPQALCVLREHPRPRPKSGKVHLSDTRPGDVRERAARVEGNDSAPSETPPLSACVPLCAIFLGKPSVYPLSPVKANVGRLCEKLKIGIRSGLKQRCGGNFWAIFAGTVLDEKPNFLSRIFGRGRPFDFSTR